MIAKATRCKDKEFKAVKMNLAELRENYQKGELLESMVDPNPLEQFKIWFKQAQSAQVPEPNAMHLSTLSKSGRISGRIVLLKSVGEGFSFYTNYLSHKGDDLAIYSNAAITFFWVELQQQIRIEGEVRKLSKQDSDEYFKVRPRESQLGAWVSKQSSRIDSREFLEERFNQLVKEFEGKEVPKPDYWGGYELIPTYFEFWQGRPSRLHDRVIYQLIDGKWEIGRLAP
ncbi:pyridoxamine 5'-phosphate oxidase [Sandaracinomonas limnophila]|nr:pyridoxamine 5'-phosphate oxidase [Sandaracinomonas limnophila]